MGAEAGLDTDTWLFLLTVALFLGGGFGFMLGRETGIGEGRNEVKVKGKEEMDGPPLRTLTRLPGQTFASEERGVNEAVALMKDAARILKRVRLKTGFGDSSKAQLCEAIELIHQAIGSKT